MELPLDFAWTQVGMAKSKLLRLLGVPNRERSAARSVEHLAPHLKSAIGTPVSEPVCGKPLLVAWADSFFFAGSSALLLLLVNLFPDYWYVSFFALTPFLYRIIKATPSEALKLGLLFGLCFFSVSAIDSPARSPLLPSVVKLLSGTALFALFGWTVGWASRRWRDWGFNPCIVAVLWVGLEVGLVKLGFVGGLLKEMEFSQPFFGGLVALFGFLTVSAIIVLLNSLLVLLVLKTLAIKRPKGKTVQEDQRRWYLFSTPWVFAEKVYLVPEGRAPPCLIKTVYVTL